MNILTTILIVFTFNSLTQADKNCENLATLIYEDLKCVPKLGPDGCPKSYDCSSLKPKENHCLFQGVYYKGGEFINGTSGCNVGCFCSTENPKKAEIVCAILDCYFGPNEQPECYNVFTHESCCFAGKQCPPFDNLATCKNEGKTYREGERFYPQDSCFSCICGKGYKGVYEEPFCKRSQCDVEIRNSGILSDHCAPAYRKNDIRCCPNAYVCPQNSVIENIECGGKKSEETCKFGEKEFNVKDKLVVTFDGSRKATCTCSIPPLLTCELPY